MRHAAETEVGHKLSSSTADSARAQEVATALVQKFDGDAAEKMAFIRDFSREKNTAGTLDTLETVTKNGLPAVVTERKRRGDTKAPVVAPGSTVTCGKCNHFKVAGGSHTCELTEAQAFFLANDLAEGAPSTVETVTQDELIRADRNRAEELAMPNGIYQVSVGENPTDNWREGLSIGTGHQDAANGSVLRHFAMDIVNDSFPKAEFYEWTIDEEGMCIYFTYDPSSDPYDNSELDDDGRVSTTLNLWFDREATQDLTSTPADD
jgi:hypothetical protein